ncbi:LysR family transcriptional regulator [Streptomyces sp. NPDC050428]|uniref:LysR family transcriptional regulator n=1 Tax=Streptomyces sp. NPDC050428 TaxID=3155757 RepID=UPI0034279E38
MINLRLLQTLRVMHAQGTVAATARALNLSPSAVSQQLRQLSREVGAELWEPDGRRIRLTTAGCVLLYHADLLSAQWERARADLADHGGGSYRTLRIGGFATSIGPLLAPTAQALREASPSTRTTVADIDTRCCYEQLLAGKLDIAVLTPLPGSPPMDDPRFDQQPLMDDYVDLVVPAGHPLAGCARVELAKTADEDWIAPHHDQRRLIEALCAAAGFAPRMVHHADEWSAVLSLISHGLGICLVPRLVPLTTHPELVRLCVSGDPPPFRRVLTCVRRGSCSQPTISDGLAGLRARAALSPWT